MDIWEMLSLPVDRLADLLKNTRRGARGYALIHKDDKLANYFRTNMLVYVGSIEDARSFCQAFFSWYNTEHRHTGIGLFTPECVHYGRAEVVYTSRKEVLRAAYEAHPERFVKKIPAPPQLPTEAWINKPKPAQVNNEKVH